MKKYLITGARAPAALAVAKNLKRHGHKVYIVDSCRFPVVRGSRYIDGAFQTAKPRFNFANFQKETLDITVENNIDCVLPMTEEIFYISLFKKYFPDDCEVYCDNFTKLLKLHHKVAIMEMAEDCGIQFPSSYRLADIDLLQFENQLQHYVAKAIYSRFGSSIYLNPNLKIIQKLMKQQQERYILQEKIIGTEYCTYDIAHQGKSVYSVIYQPTFRIPGSASFYFTPVKNTAIQKFTRQFIKKHQFTGQIGFDIIENKTGIYLIECNPRANSGIFFASDLDTSKLFAGESLAHQYPTQPLKLSSIMESIGLKRALLTGKFKIWQKANNAARNAIFDEGENKLRFYDFLCFCEILYSCIRYRKSLRNASTFDIEFTPE